MIFYIGLMQDDLSMELSVVPDAMAFASVTGGRPV
jgi:hypothetical protein